MLGVASLEQLPPEGPPEIAFAGRSNVGKSSLLNALVGRKNLARASSTPGRTQEINYFSLDAALRLVDLPGYGYAQAARRDARRWASMTRDFLKARSTLRRVCVLVDARHGLKTSDEETMNLLDQSAAPYQIILTKIDKLNEYEARAIANDVAAAIQRRPAAHPDVIATSSETGAGIGELRAELARFAI